MFNFLSNTQDTSILDWLQGLPFLYKCQHKCIWALKTLHKWHFIVFHVILKIAACLRAKQYLKYRPFGSLGGKRVLFGHFHHIKEKNRLQDWSWNLNWEAGSQSKPPSGCLGLWMWRLTCKALFALKANIPFSPSTYSPFKTVLLMPGSCLVYHEFRRQTLSS